jgi:zinc finger HIT domain-containing protein 1
MNNFGVIEVAGAKTTNAPGWAYVPDTGINPAVTALQPASRKRARNQPKLTLSDLSARQEAKIRKDIEALDRDSQRDVNIPIPQKAGGSKGEPVQHSE